MFNSGSVKSPVLLEDSELLEKRDEEESEALLVCEDSLDEESLDDEETAVENELLLEEDAVFVAVFDAVSPQPPRRARTMIIVSRACTFYGATTTSSTSHPAPSPAPVPVEV